MLRFIRVVTVLSAIALALAGCGQQPNPTPPTTSLLAGEALAPIDPATISGPIEITGSSTVYPLTARIAEEFHADGSPAQIDVKVTGTGGGFRSFCNGDDVDIVNASRPIADNEIAACRAVGREPVGFQVGVDALAVVVSNQNTFVQRLTFEQLAAIFSGEARRWRDVDAAFPDQPITIFSPGVDSGTFDYFVEEVLGGDDQRITAIPGIVLSESDTELRSGVEEDPFAIGYFGYAYYRSDEERLRALPVDRGSGAILPGEATVTDGSYPLARPLFVYTSEQTLGRSPAVAAFVSYYLQHVGDVVADVGYFSVPDEAIAAAQQELVAVLQ